jgi:UBX domain-containing protein 1
MANIHGVYSKKNGSGGGSDDDDDGNKFYVGGTDGRGGGSGQNVLDPTSGTGSGSDPYAGMKASASQASGDTFDESGARVITLYSNGFMVDDGPFRALTDPANKQFIEEMNQGIIPTELRTGAEQGGGGNVNVALKNKSSEEYVPPPPPAYVAYSGDGKSTGGAAVAEGALVSGAEDASTPVPEVDESKPSATIAVRLHTGKRLRAKLNLDHTVRHLQALIAVEGAGDVPYVLMAGFPPAQLTDFNQTIEAAGLAGSQVTQKKV